MGIGETNEENLVMVLPVYNEADNIEAMIESLDKSRKDLDNCNLIALFVDDSSPDGTGELISKISQKYEWVKLHVRKEKQGLGKTYVDGFSFAIKNLSPQYIGQMDSDLSHDPKFLVPMLSSIRDGSDVCIGSRYVRGGGVEGWPFSRKVISRGGNAVARVLGGIWSIKDCTSGFTIMRYEAVQKALKSPIDVDGYAFQVHLKNSLKSSGSVISETPIIFRDRIFGESKLGNSDIAEFFFSVLRLRFN